MTETNNEPESRSTPTRTPSASTASEASSTVSTSPSNSAKIKSRSKLLHILQILKYFFPNNPEDTEDGRFKDHVTYENVSAYPLGYPSLAAYQNSDPTFRVYKRFGTLRNRVILHKQHELAILEMRLNELDERDNKDSKHNYRIRSVRRDTEDAASERAQLINEIDTKLKHYDGRSNKAGADELLERELRSGLMQKPTKRNYRSLVNYLWNRGPIVRSEMKYLKHRDDFVMLTGKSESPLELTLDRLICRVPWAWFRSLFSTEAERNKFDKDDDGTTLTSTEKVAQLARFIASFLAILLIGIPLYALTTNRFSEKPKIIVLLISLVLFPAAIQIAARPKNHDLFVATATYCAVLSTFLAASQNLNSSQTSSQLGEGNKTVVQRFEL